MSAWPVVALGSKVRFLSGGTPRKDEAKYWNGEIPWVGSAEMVQRRINDTELRVTEEGAREGSKLVPANTVLVVVRGMSLAKEFRVAITERELTFNQDLKALKPAADLDPVFLFYYLLSQNSAIRDSASEAAHGTKKLDMPVLEQWPIPLPPLEVQCKIAAILSAYDDLIANNQRRISLLESMAEEIYREWFVRMRFPGHESAHTADFAPSRWSRSAVGDLCQVIKRGITPKYADDADRLVINQKCIRDGRVSLDDARAHDTVVPDEKLLRYGDVLINSTGVGTLGRVAVFDLAVLGATCDTHVTICRAKASGVGAEYLSHTLCALQNYFESMAAGSTGQSELGREVIARTKITLPPDDLRMKFGEIVTPMRKQRRALLDQNVAMASVRDALLPRLISGKLKIDHLEIQLPPSMREKVTA
jgi:type I restriction enzyme, S subunit